MRKSASQITFASPLAAIAVGLALTSGAVFADAVAEGKELAFDRALGNCLACHVIEGGESPGDIGPPLVAMKARFPDKGKLRAQIWDSTVANPETIMPAFGRMKVLSDSDIDKIVEFIYTL